MRQRQVPSQEAAAYVAGSGQDMSAKILWWHPMNPPRQDGPVAVQPFWSVYKQQWRIDCMLQGRSADGWNVRVLLNGEWFFYCRFTSWNEAIRAISSKHAELVAAGWSPGAVAAEGR